MTFRNRFSLRMKPAAFLLVILLAAPAYGVQLHQSAMIDVPGAPGFAQMAFARGMLIIAHEAADRADVYDPARRRFVAQINGLKSPHGIAVDERGGRVYISNSGANNIAVVDTRTWTVQGTIPLQEAPYGLLLSFDGKVLYVANWRAQSLSAVATDGSGRITTEPLEGSPQAMVFDPARGQLYVTLQDRDEIAVLDPGLKLLHRYPLAASQPTGMALDPVARRLYVAVRYAVLALNADSGSEVARIAAPAGANSVTLTGNGSALYVASGGGYVDVIRTAGGAMALEQEVQTDVRGSTLAYDAERDLVYLPGGREGRAKLVILKKFRSGPAAPANEAQVAER